MTSDDERRERDLRAGLSALLDDVHPGQPPVAAVRRKGRAMRLSRRLAVAAGVVVAVAAVVVIPAALHGIGGQLPVSPVGKAGVIASGRLEGRPWRIVVDQKAGRLCAGETGLRQSCVSLRSLERERLNGPVSMSGAIVAEDLHPPRIFYGLPIWNAFFGIVRPDATRVVMSLYGERAVTLRPVLMAGYRWVGLVVAPAADSETFVTKATVYSGATELGYSVPDSVGPYHGGMFRPRTFFVSWYRPGETAPAQRSWDIAGGGSGSHFWDARMDAGPWGYCVTLQAPVGSGIPENCWSPDSLRASARVIMRIGSPPAVPRWIVGTARPSVAYLLMALANGRSVKVPVAVFSGQGFYAMRIGRGPAIVRWGAYDAAGRRLYGGLGAPDTQTPAR